MLILIYRQWLSSCYFLELKNGALLLVCTDVIPYTYLHNGVLYQTPYIPPKYIPSFHAISRLRLDALVCTSWMGSLEQLKKDPSVRSSTLYLLTGQEGQCAMELWDKTSIAGEDKDCSMLSCQQPCRKEAGDIDWQFFFCHHATFPIGLPSWMTLLRLLIHTCK